MLANLKDENIKYLELMRVIFETERQKLCERENIFVIIDEDGKEASGLKDNSCISYYQKLTATIEKIDDYLDSEKDYINECKIKEIEEDILSAEFYTISYKSQIGFNEAEFINYAIPLLKVKLTKYEREMQELIDSDFKKVYFDKSGHYSIGLKNTKDLGLYLKLKEVIDCINKFMIDVNPLIRKDMECSMQAVDEIIDSMQITM